MQGLSSFRRWRKEITNQLLYQLSDALYDIAWLHFWLPWLPGRASVGDWVEFELKAERALCVVSDQPPCAPRIALAMCSGRTPTPTIRAAIRWKTGRREMTPSGNGGARGFDPSRASRRVITRL